MWKYKLCMGTDAAFGIPIKEQIKMFKRIGFEGFFTEWSAEHDISGYKRLGDEIGIEYQSIHAPFGRAADMWRDNEAAKSAVDELLCCLNDCAENRVPIMVAHAFIGFEDHTPTEAGIKNYRLVAEKAQKLGVKIALENTEGEEYLAALLFGLRDKENVGFCFDSGHEMCYNHSQDLLKLYGDRLLCTHLNDNLGIRDFGGEITWRDDLHLLPFDGAGDWEGIAARLDRCRYNDFLTFELCKKSKPERHENDVYDRMSPEEYFTEAYKRACRVAALRGRAEK